MNPPGPRYSFDRNLYFGVLAIRMGYIRTESFFASANSWKSSKNDLISEILLVQEPSNAEELQSLDRTVDAELADSTSNPLELLFEKVGPLAMGFELALRGLRDPDIDATLDKFEKLRYERSDPELGRSDPVVSDFSVSMAVRSDHPFEPDISDDEIRIPSFPYLDPPDAPESLGVLGAYRIIRLLGEGAYGTVFHGFDTRLHRNVAIKVLKPGVGNSAPPRRRFLREARAGAQVDHPNIVRVYGVEESPLPFLIMEYVEGETLQQYLKSRGPLPLSDVLEFARQLAEGVAAAHEARLIHRDIKPANILIAAGSPPVIKISDFGLVRVTYEACISASDEIHGTPLFMSPEQAKGRTVGFASDMFSLGSVIYAMTTGFAPFDAETTLAILRKVMYERPTPIQKLAPDTPDWFVEIVDKLLAKRRSVRTELIGSARNLAELLKRKKAELDSGELPRSSRVSMTSDPVELDSGDIIQGPRVRNSSKAEAGAPPSPNPTESISASMAQTRPQPPSIPGPPLPSSIAEAITARSGRGFVFLATLFLIAIGVLAFAILRLAY